MSIATAMDGVLATIQLHDDYDKNNSSIGDFSILDKGHDSAVVLLYLPSEHGPGVLPGGHQRKGSNHKITIRVYRRYEYDKDSYENLLDDVSTVMSHINSYPKLNSTTNVIRAIVTDSGSVFTRMTLPGDTPVDLRMDLTLEVWEEV